MNSKTNLEPQSNEQFDLGIDFVLKSLSEHETRVCDQREIAILNRSITIAADGTLEFDLAKAT
jgi:hypothetical protein